MTATGMVMGTAQYLSPEQAVGRPATASSDLYSLGIVAYESLAGHRPFTGPTAVDIAVAHVNDPVPPLPRSVSRPVADLVLELLAKDPADRPPSADALARRLDALVGHTPPDGVPVPDDAPARAGGARPQRRPPRPPAGRPPVGRPPAGASTGGAPPAAADPARPGAASPPVPVPVRSSPARPGPGPDRVPPSYPPRREIPDPRVAGRPPSVAAGGAGAPASTSPAGPVPRPRGTARRAAGRPAGRPAGRAARRDRDGRARHRLALRPVPATVRGCGPRAVHGHPTRPDVDHHRPPAGSRRALELAAGRPGRAAPGAARRRPRRRPGLVGPGRTGPGRVGPQPVGPGRRRPLARGPVPGHPARVPGAGTAAGTVDRPGDGMIDACAPPGVPVVAAPVSADAPAGPARSPSPAAPRPARSPAPLSAPSPTPKDA